MVENEIISMNYKKTRIKIRSGRSKYGITQIPSQKLYIHVIYHLRTRNISFTYT